ncbi:MAG: alpha-amylase family glycosyl hydrolase [Muribaculaceae bacterium]|nr:alpha-amylase family glycosyl hydrolase [Muribaculaceae bacterium]
MKKTYFAIIAMLLAAILPAAAQIVTTTPQILQEGSQGVVLTYHADSPLGNKGLMNLSNDFDVYAHIGVITDKSAGEWAYVVAPWPESGNQQAANTAKNRLTRTATNTYTLNIGNIRTYFGITDANEHVKQIAMVLRNADASKTGRTSSGGDIFVTVTPDGFATELTSDHPDRVISSTTKITYTLRSSEAATLSLSVNGTAFATKSSATELVASYTFDKEGTYTVEGKANYGGKDYVKTLEVSYPSASLAQNYPGGVPKMGAVKNADGTVTFCIAAPGKVSAVLVGSWEDYEVLEKNTMKYQDYQGNRYFWTTVSGLANDQWYSYYYLIDDKYKVADPYAHLVLDCYTDATTPAAWRSAPKHPGSNSVVAGVMLAVYRGDIDDYTFSPFTIPEHDNLVVYELLLRDFTGIDGKALANGTVRKAIDKIPYIKSLGVNVVELMPVMKFNGKNSWGYNTNFYMAPDQIYGSPTDYKDFVEECHRNGIAVVLDIVFNQSDGLHPWYQMYDIDKNPFYNKEAPHSWSVLNDWNQGHPLVQQQWTDALKYWMEKYNVDGYRFDLVKGLGDNESYAGIGTDGYNTSRINRMKRLHSVIKSVKPDGIHINEFLGGAQEEREMGADGQIQWANVNNNSCQFAMGYDDKDYSLSRFLSTSDGNRPWGSTVSYAESHDEQRVAFKSEVYGKGSVPTDPDVRYNRLAQLAVQMLMTPGPKMVWMFGELGNSQNTKEKPDGSGGNDTGAKIVDWRWLDDPHKAFLKDTYAAIINMRTANPDLMKQSATYSWTGLASKYTTGRTQRLTAGDKEVIAFINPSLTDAATVSATSVNLSVNNAKLICASKGHTPTLTGSGTSLKVSLPANGFAVFATNTVDDAAGVTDVIASGSEAQAYGAQGEIIIVGDYTNVAVYDIAGRYMPGLTVPAGIYIVNIDGKATKVTVR